MKSKKDQGNAFFKQQKYAEAIQCYKQYVKTDHEDNSKAYGNLALSCFKIKKYQDCIQACQKSVELDPQFQKGYYRMYQAYKQLKDYYGMVIAGSKFCKISKQQKQIQTLQKSLVQAKQKLSFKENKITNQTANDKIILEIINQGQECKQSAHIIKQPQCSLDSKWLRIIQRIKNNKYDGYNAGLKFIMKECTTNQQKEKYKKLLAKIKYQGLKENTNNENVKDGNKSDSEEQQQQIKVQELEKYNQKKSKQLNKITSLKQKILDNKPGIQAKITQTSFKKVKSPTQNHQLTNKQQQKSSLTVLKEKHQNQKSNQIRIQPTQKPQQQQSKSKNQIINNEAQEKWQKYLTDQEGNRLFQKNIQAKLDKTEDKFQGFYDCVVDVLRSVNLDKYQKMAILTLASSKVKKFNLILKSYTGRQKQQMVQLFTENNLHFVLEKYYFKK